MRRTPDGILYSLVTLHLGVDFNDDEYKVMGLARYGDPARFRHFFDHIVQLHPGGSIRIPVLQRNHTREEGENYTATRQYLTDQLLPARHPDEELTAVHRDLAAALQECLEKVILHICGHFGNATGMRRLALAGGVALNCTANGQPLVNTPREAIETFLATSIDYLFLENLIVSINKGSRYL